MKSSKVLVWIAFVSQRYILKECPNQQRHFWMKEGDIPALSCRTHTSTRREWVEYFLRLSAKVDGCTFFIASRRRLAILLPVIISNGAFLVL